MTGLRQVLTGGALLAAGELAAQPGGPFGRDAEVHSAMAWVRSSR